MGRYVWPIAGPVDFVWKFVFAKQSSDFGELLEEACPEFVNRYTSMSGEVVEVSGPAGEITRKVGDYIEKMDLHDYDVRMLQKFIEAVRQAGDEDELIEAWFYVEY